MKRREWYRDNQPAARQTGFREFNRIECFPKIMFKAWEWYGRKCDAVLLPSFVVAKPEERNARRGIFFTVKNAFFPVYVWYLGRATRLPPTSELIAGVNVDYVRRLCICADLYVYSRVSTSNTRASSYQTFCSLLPLPSSFLMYDAFAMI